MDNAGRLLAMLTHLTTLTIHAFTPDSKPTSFTNLSHPRLSSGLRTHYTDFMTGPFLLSISVFMAAVWNDRPLYFCPVVSFFLCFFFFPRLISAVADWMSTILPHMVLP